MRRLVRLAIGVALGAAVCGPARAQDLGWSTILPSVAGIDTLGLVLRAQIAGGKTDGPARDTAVAGLRFTPSPTRRTAHLARIVAQTRAVDPDNAADLERLFAADFFGRLAGPLGGVGLRTDDLADAYAIWWIGAWNAAQGSNASPSRTMAQAVRWQAARALGAVPSIAQASDAEKQEFAEALLVQATLIDTAIKQNKRYMAGLRVIHSSVIDGARTLGLDLEAMTLTEAGFVPA